MKNNWNIVRSSVEPVDKNGIISCFWDFFINGTAIDRFDEAYVSVEKVEVESVEDTKGNKHPGLLRYYREWSYLFYVPLNSERPDEPRCLWCFINEDKSPSRGIVEYRPSETIKFEKITRPIKADY